MYRSSKLGELLAQIPKSSFQSAVKQHSADKYSKGFSSWDQLVALVYAQLSGATSLRKLESSFNAQHHHHYHLGSRSIKRSTLAEANSKRSPEVFAKVCADLSVQVQRRVKREVLDLLYIIDSSPIDLRGRGFDDWVGEHRSRAHQGMKLHLMLEGNSQAPVFIDVQHSNRSDIKIGREMPVHAGATYTFDRGYYDYNWWHQIDQQGSIFVSRFKKNVNIQPDSEPLSATVVAPILEDSKIKLGNRYVKNRTEKNRLFGKALRKVVVDRPERDTPLVLVTNDFQRSAEEVAGVYKRRWGIELFFKWIKQNLKIKRFLGQSENAVRIQIYCALVAYLLLYLKRATVGLEEAPYLTLAALANSLFERPDIDLPPKVVPL